MGGRGSASRMAWGSRDYEGWREAFDPGVDYEASGDVNHEARTVSSYVRARWEAFSHGDVSASDRAVLDKDYEHVRGVGMTTYGYIRTYNSFKINEALYDPANEGKTDEEIFTRRDNAGQLRDLQTVRALDRMINTHTTSVDGTYSRYSSADAIKATFGFTDAQMETLARAGVSGGSNLSRLNRLLNGRSGYSRAYTSASANRSLNAFKDKHVWERRLYVPKGTNAYLPRNNAQESEAVFGRNMNTRIIGITVEDGRMVIHEAFDGYRKR